VHAQLRELLTNYGPLAGIWLDPIMGYYARPDLFPIQETYALIRELQPQTLIAFKQGATGTEDFASPERSGHSLADRVREQVGPDQAEIAQRAWERNKDKHNEICDTLQPGAWGYVAGDDGKHRTADEVLRMLADADSQNCNLLLNTGPLPDGSIHCEDVTTLREVGPRIRRDGWPAGEQ
jgi:alpha-L-fucosidase